MALPTQAVAQSSEASPPNKRIGRVVIGRETHPTGQYDNCPVDPDVRDDEGNAMRVCPPRPSRPLISREQLAKLEEEASHIELRFRCFKGGNLASVPTVDLEVDYVTQNRSTGAYNLLVAGGQQTYLPDRGEMCGSYQSRK